MAPVRGISSVFPNLPAAALAAGLREEDHLEKAQRGSSSSVPRLPPPATPHTYSPPAPLPFQAWYSVCPGSSILGSGMEVVVSLMGLPPTTPSISHPFFWPLPLQRMPYLFPATRGLIMQSKELGPFCFLSPASKRWESLSPLESTVQIPCCLDRETEAQREVAYSGSH